MARLTKVLVVEDHPKLARLLFRALCEEGYSVDLCTSGEETLRPALGRTYDLLVLGQHAIAEEEQRLCARLRSPMLRADANRATSERRRVTSSVEARSAARRAAAPATAVHSSPRSRRPTTLSSRMRWRRRAGDAAAGPHTNDPP